jgi:glycosyltransferase involved in cell wall biosynthesis
MPAMTLHLVTGEWPPLGGGVGDYTEQLANALAEHGCRVHVWTRGQTGVRPLGSRGQTGVRPLGSQVHTLEDDFGPRSVAALAQGVDADPGAVILQYVPNALGRRGLNVPFCLALMRLRKNGVDVRVMFHEPFFYFTLTHPLRNGLAIAQRAMAAILLRASPVVYVATEAWRRLLMPYGSHAAHATILPIPSTIAVVHAPGEVARWRSMLVEDEHRPIVIGHFGTFGDHMAAELDQVIPEVLGVAREAVFLCIGRRSEEYASRFIARHPQLAARVKSTGEVEREHLSAVLQVADLLVQPYPDGVTTRRTSVMAGLAHGIPTVTTHGALTDRVWTETGAVALAPAGAPKAIASEVSLLLDGTAHRAVAGQRGRRVYEERFSMAHTVRTLLDATHPTIARSA